MSESHVAMLSLANDVSIFQIVQAMAALWQAISARLAQLTIKMAGLC
jgi:hypothetical protein